MFLIFFSVKRKKLENEGMKERKRETERVRANDIVYTCIYMKDSDISYTSGR